MSHPSGSERTSLVDALLAAANRSGGWAYFSGRTSRIEPTCWALLALAGSLDGGAMERTGAHRDFLVRCQRSTGWLVEDSPWPTNVGFNALAAVTWLHRRDAATDEHVQRLLASLVGMKGVQAPPSPSYTQDNSLQGWPWVDATFSWVEPTAWSVLALKKATRVGLLSDTLSRGRIEDGERLLIDRCCRDGGWNFGNANVMGQDLYPHVPPTAVALIALQDRRDEPAVARSLAFLESHWADEVSMMAIGLSMQCLSVFGRPIDQLDTRLRAHLSDRGRAQADSAASGLAAPLSNVHGVAIALTALSLGDHESAFRI